MAISFHYPTDFSAHNIALCQQTALNVWGEKGIVAPLLGEMPAFMQAIMDNHACNYQLWATEDCARRDDQGPEYVYRAKREIDKLNQARNNAMERIDDDLMVRLNPSESSSCPLHTETPGMIIDRLSILSLKTYHMGLQTKRTDAPAAHVEQCQAKHHILQQQRADLVNCLATLFDDISQQKRTFKRYRQFKMYNDPALNPALYKETTP